MLLSPEVIISQTEGATLERGVTLRFEDFLLVVIGLSWFAKNAIIKELGLFSKTPLNKAILFYLLGCIVSTSLGIIAGRVGLKTGCLFVVKYIEYFIVFFMMVNHVKSKDQIKRFIFCFFLTCFITSILGIFQIPGGERVSAPFEGEIGEPNTFGGYLLFMGAIAIGMLLKVENRRTKQMLVLLIAVIIPPLLFTQSRSSYVAMIAVFIVFGFMTHRRVIVLGLIIVFFLLSPFFLPAQVKNRILYTFKQPEQSGQISIGEVHLDTSTSARIKSLKESLRDWLKHPILGYGVTGYNFVDAQYLRVLVETGIVGLLTFFYLLYSVLKLAFDNMRDLKAPLFEGINVGFLAGFIGLLVHSLGANTFIIVRIMEPFWFFTGIIAVLPELERQSIQAESQVKEIPRGKLASVRTPSQKSILKHRFPFHPRNTKNTPRPTF
jgi:O-antigen ligase